MKLTVMACALYVSLMCSSAAQECATLQHANPATLVSYLDNIQPNEQNADCITVAIKKLTAERSESAIPALTKLLDFRRPLTESEKGGFFRRPMIREELYPAAGALEEIGKKALPAVLDVIKASSSAIARENGVVVWMEVYKDDAATGVALLRQEAAGAIDLTAKDNLMLALQKAPTFCGPKDMKRCKAAAVLPKSQ